MAKGAEGYMRVSDDGIVGGGGSLDGTMVSVVFDKGELKITPEPSPPFPMVEKPEAPDNTFKQLAYSNDANKVRYDLLPPELLEAVATALTVGANKYPERNWEQGIEWSRTFASCQRHLWAFHAGEDDDPETGLPHLWLAGARLAMLITQQVRGIGVDNRVKTKPK